MSRENLQLVGAYVCAGVIFGFTGYMLVTRQPVPEWWSALVSAAAGFVFLGQAVAATVRRLNRGR